MPNNNKTTKKDWEQFAIAFWIILFLKFFAQQAHSVEFANMGALIASIIIGILIGYYAFQLTKKKSFILLGLTGVSTAFSIFAFFVVWKLRSNQIKK